MNTDGKARFCLSAFIRVYLRLEILMCLIRGLGALQGEPGAENRQPRSEHQEQSGVHPYAGRKAMAAEHIPLEQHGGNHQAPEKEKRYAGAPYGEHHRQQPEEGSGEENPCQGGAAPRQHIEMERSRAGSQRHNGQRQQEQRQQSVVEIAEQTQQAFDGFHAGDLPGKRNGYSNASSGSQFDGMLTLHFQTVRIAVGVL